MMKTITTTELQEKLEAGQQLQVIDVREDEEVAAGMVPDAKHIALGTLPERIGEIDGTQPVHVICRSGRRSERACEFLEANGIEAINVEGGMLDWDGETIA
jgi:rhodanese-related sulfurtransferase